MKLPPFASLIGRFVRNYKRYVGLNFMFNVLSTVFSLFTFALIIPILNILFKIEQTQYEYQPLDWSGDVAGTLKNNAYWWTQQYISDNGGIATLVMLGVVLVVMSLLKNGCSYLASYFIIPLRTGVVRDLRSSLYEKIVDLNIGFFHHHKKGDIISRMTSDVNEVEASIMSSVEMLTKNPIMILIYFGVMMWLSWQLTVFVLLVLPLAGWLMGKVGKSLKRKSKIAQNQMGQLLSQIEETLSGLRVVKAFNAENAVIRRFEQMNNALRGTTNSMNRRNTMAHPMSEFLGTITIAIVLVFGGALIIDGESTLEASVFIYYLIIFYSIINPAKDLSKAWYSIEKGRASLERIDAILHAENPLKIVKNPVPLKPFSSKIEFRNVWFKYEDQWVLKDINLTIEKGKTVALVGASGSGKSTLVDLLPRFYDVQQGQVLIDGVDVRSMTLEDVRSQMGNVNQEAILFNDTIANNITFGTKGATHEQIVEAAKIANAHEFIEQTEEGYSTNIGDRGERLSGGQRQRLSIARAILKNPPILILDEATSALDTESERLVQEALENLMKSRTTIMIAHRLSTIRNADEICVLNEGEIVERGRHDDLIKLGGIYKKLCDMQKF